MESVSCTFGSAPKERISSGIPRWKVAEAVCNAVCPYNTQKRMLGVAGGLGVGVVGRDAPELLWDAGKGCLYVNVVMITSKPVAKGDQECY